ncbi:MAG: hypothetical protein NWQ46_00280, partial [Spirosomaceae bacterium]|nr:hypothetical protein [Spirosomataceae bacterium]
NIQEIFLVYQIQKKWIKTDLQMADGSAVYRPELMYMQLQYKFISKDSLQLTLDGITSIIDYTIKDSVLSYGSGTLRFFIKELTDVKLVLKEISKKDESEKLMIEFIPQKFYDLGYVPTTYLAKNNDVVFLADENHIYPYFVNSKLPAIAFISEKFEFPEWRRGSFLARFIITKYGKLVGVRVEESTNPKYNSKLVAAIKKTEKMWLPAEFDGEKITSEVVMEFKMDFPTYGSDESPVAKLELSQQQLADGNYYFEEKLYRSAISSYTEAIKNDFKNVDAYYRRAAAYVFMKETKKACEDYEQLMYLKQTKATVLYTKYCEGNETEQN